MADSDTYPYTGAVPDRDAVLDANTLAHPDADTNATLADGHPYADAAANLHTDAHAYPPTDLYTHRAPPAVRDADHRANINPQCLCGGRFRQ